MKASDIKVGEVYVAKVSGKLTHVRVDEIETKAKVGFKSNYLGQSKVRHGTRYHCTNLKTGREVTFKSAMKFRLRAAPPIAAKHQLIQVDRAPGSDQVEVSSLCTCGADRTGPTAEAHDPDCPQAVYDRHKEFQAGGNESNYN